MKNTNLLFGFILAVILSQCKPLQNQENGFPHLDIITKEVIENNIYKSDFNTYKDSIVIIVDLLMDKDFINNSKYLLQISADNKKALTQYKNDSIFNFNGMDLYIASDNQMCRNLFNQNFRYLSKDIDKSIVFNKRDYTERWESLLLIDFYINKKNEITHISDGYDKRYYNLLKTKLKFSKEFLDNNKYK